jgi:hypothetical protein
VHHDNTAEDVELFADALLDVVTEARPRPVPVPRVLSAVPSAHGSRRGTRQRRLTLVSGRTWDTVPLEPGA